MIETRLLHYFLAIAREQNITKAAETLFVTQSTLSKQMMDLEKQLGKQLFIRGKRKITLTEEGTSLRNRAQEILEFMDNTESAFHADADNVLDRLDKGLVNMGLLLGPIRQEKYDYLNIHQKDSFGLLMPKDCKLAPQKQI